MFVLSRSSCSSRSPFFENRRARPLRAFLLLPPFRGPRSRPQTPNTIGAYGNWPENAHVGVWLRWVVFFGVAGEEDKACRRGGRPVVRGWTELRTEPRTEPRTGQSPNPPELRPRTTAPYDGVSPPYDGPNHGRTVGRRIVVSATDQGPPIHGSARHISPPYVLCEARMRDCPALHHTSLKRSLYQTLAFGHRMRLNR